MLVRGLYDMQSVLQQSEKNSAGGMLGSYYEGKKSQVDSGEEEQEGFCFFTFRLASSSSIR